MHPPTKDQTDIGKDAPTVDASDNAEIVFGENASGIENVIDNKDMARQEFGAEADINNMLSRFGVVPDTKQPIYGVWDETLDLQQAITSTREARNAYQQLPEELRKKFGSMEELLNAIENGSLEIRDEKAPEEPKPA